MKEVKRFESFDGELFPTKADCRAHEATLAHVRLVGLTIEQVKAAIARTDVDLADAIETVGAKIGRARRESGDLRRERRGKTAAADPGDENRRATAPLAPGSADDGNAANEAEAA